MSQSSAIFKQLLGETYQQLPSVIQKFHNTPHISWQGKAKAEGSTNLLAKLLRRLLGFPEPAEDLPVNVNVSFTNKGEERWTRKFGDKQFSSYLALASNSPNLMYEKFGLVNQYFTLEFTENWLCWRLMYCTFLGIRLPKFLEPRVIANEGVNEQGAYQFVAKVTLPIVGTLVAYQGYLDKTTDLS